MVGQVILLLKHIINLILRFYIGACDTQYQRSENTCNLYSQLCIVFMLLWNITYAAWIFGREQELQNLITCQVFKSVIVVLTEYA
jgi:DMSO reductase anchor subunit